MPRGGKRKGAGRPLLNSKKGKRHTHGITLYDEIWEKIEKEAERNNVSSSRLIEQIIENFLFKSLK